MTVELQVAQGWLTVCELSSLIPGRGVAALLPDGSQAAVFLDRAGRPYAIGNQDPFTGAQVLSRGLVGTVGGRPFVASPAQAALRPGVGALPGRRGDDGPDLPGADRRDLVTS